MNDTRIKLSPVSVIGGAAMLTILAFAAGIFFAGYTAFGRENLVPPGAPEGVDLSPVWKAWSLIDDKFVPASVASTTGATTTDKVSEERVWGMIEGLAASLNDPYTYFLPPTETKEFTADMSGSFEGIGMEIAVKSGVLTVVSPLKGTPAEFAGLKSGDQILKIDDTSTKDMDTTTAVRLIRGPKGTEVTLT